MMKGPRCAVRVTGNALTGVPSKLAVTMNASGSSPKPTLLSLTDLRPKPKLKTLTEFRPFTHDRSLAKRRNDGNELSMTHL